MARHGTPSRPEVSQAEVEGAIAGYFGVLPIEPGIRDLARVVFPGVESASRQNPAGWRSVIPNVLANHVSMARGLGLAGSALQQQLDIMRHSNRTSAEFAQALSRVQTLVAGMGGWSRVATAEGGSGGHPSSTARAMEIHGGPYTESNLSAEMRSYGAQGYSRSHMAGVGNYLHGIGMDGHQVNQYAGFFAGSSDAVRHAIRDHVKAGAQLTDEHVTNANDARAIMGAIKAGKIKSENAPPSVQKLMEEMKAKGVDPATADPNAIDKYFKDNPAALDAAKKEAAADQARVSELTNQQVKDKGVAVAEKTAQAAEKAKAPRQQLATKQLNLG